jgi:hypothetical protein
MPAKPLKQTYLQGVMSTSATKKDDLGTLRIEADGRAYRYCKAGSSDLAAGKMGVCAVAVANHINKAPVADVAAGAKSLSITVGATAVTAGQYEGGWLQVNDGVGEGTMIPIKAHTACASAGTTVITLADPLPLALTNAGSEVSLIPNPWNGITETDVEENVPAGVAPVAVTASYYYWAQVAGPACVLVSGTPAVGSLLTLAATAGAVGALSTTIATTVTQPIIGTMLATAGVTTEYKPVLLNI